MAPELLGDDVEYDATKVDVWAYGVLLHYLWTRKAPYKNLSNVQILRRIMEGKFLEIPPEVPPPVASLIEACWDIVPAKRPGMDEVAKQLDLVQQQS
jgi:serine/threonine protein kinase